MSSTTQMTSNKPTSGLLALDEDAQLVLPGAETAQIQREFVSVGLFDDHEDGAMRIAMMMSTGQRESAQPRAISRL